MTGSVLIYNGSEIRAVSERLNLTDMWKSAGSPPKQRPADWKNDGSNIAFLDHVALISNAAVDGIWRGTKGNGGSTWAHWQIGLAYAKYLSPEFHMWCNTVVRDRMEGKATPSDELAELMRRTDGICRMLAHKTTGIEAVLGAATDTLLALAARVDAMVVEADGRVAAIEYSSARELLDAAGAMPKGRRSLNGRVGNALRALCLADGIKARRCARTRTYLFPIGTAQDWMARTGRDWVAAHNSAVAGQGVFTFKRRAQ